MRTVNDLDSRKKWTLVFVLAALPLFGWWMYGLFDLDEGFYGAVVAEMNRRGEWITPYYNGHPWFEKPILLYWIAKPCLWLFGDMFGPRLPSVLATLGMYAIVAWFAKRRLSENAAQMTVLILASSLLVVATGRMMLTDPLLNLCFTGAMIFFWESLVGDRRWRLLSAALLGFSVLAKGPVGLLLFVPVVAFTFWKEPELRPNFKGWWLLGSLILAAVIATWYVPAYLANPNLFVQKFLIEQNLQRFTGGDQAHTLGGIQSLLLFVPVLLVGMLPWVFFLPWAWPRKGGAEPDVKRYLAVWAAVVFLFFSASGAKLPHYILPCAPPIAVLVGAYLTRKGFSTLLFQRAAAGIALVTLVAHLGFLYYYSLSQEELHQIARFVRAQGGDVAMFQMSRRNKDLGTGQLKVQETSQPSVLLYLNRNVLDTDDEDEIFNHPKPFWLITRPGRIQPGDYLENVEIETVMTPFPQDNYRLYSITALTPAGQVLSPAPQRR